MHLSTIKENLATKRVQFRLPNQIGHNSIYLKLVQRGVDDEVYLKQCNKLCLRSKKKEDCTGLYQPYKKALLRYEKTLLESVDSTSHTNGLAHTDRYSANKRGERKSVKYYCVITGKWVTNGVKAAQHGAKVSKTG